jgi:hypothetical protein
MAAYLLALRRMALYNIAPEKNGTEGVSIKLRQEGGEFSCSFANG